VFVSTSYWYLFLKDKPDETTRVESEDATRA
jgi:hypothetical protein